MELSTQGDSHQGAGQRAGHATYEEPQKHIIEAMGRCGIEKQTIVTTQPEEDIRQKGAAKRKRCAICPSAKDRKVSSWCSQCKEHKRTVVMCATCEESDN